MPGNIPPQQKRRQRTRDPIGALQRTLYMLLARVYGENNAWIVHAWPLEVLAEETLPKPIEPAVRQMRSLLYSYIASLGAEWSPEEENTILLRGSYIEAVKTLKALWLGLHIATVLPADLEHVTPPAPEEVYEPARLYLRLRRRLLGSAPAPYREADRLLEAAAALALAPGYADPASLNVLGAEEIIADMLYAIGKTMVG